MPTALALLLTIACSNKNGDDAPDDSSIDCSDEQEFYADNDGDGYGDLAAPTTACEAPSGFASTSDDCDDTRADVHPGADETCDGIDDDCDGTTDVDAVDERTWYADADGDGFGTDVTMIACDRPVDYARETDDCDDVDPAVNPDAAETCNTIDDDCDELVDEEDPDVLGADTWYADVDADDWGDPKTAVVACEAPKGFIDRGNDCDDLVFEVHPATPELCDGFDNDCDALVDDEDDVPAFAATTFYPDTDGDGYGDAAGTTVAACLAPSNYVTDDTDCDDTNPAWHALLDYYVDTDLDGYGDGTATNACVPGPNDVELGGDCAPLDPNINPGRAESCREGDENCNGLESEADATLVPDVWYLDADGDDHGVATDTIDSCDEPLGYVAVADDCDDADNYVYPGAAELCDSLDNDCDLLIDEAVEYVDWYVDGDADGYGNAASSVNDCTEPAGYVIDADRLRRRCLDDASGRARDLRERGRRRLRRPRGQLHLRHQRRRARDRGLHARTGARAHARGRRLRRRRHRRPPDGERVGAAGRRRGLHRERWSHERDAVRRGRDHFLAEHRAQLLRRRDRRGRCERRRVRRRADQPDPRGDVLPLPRPHDREPRRPRCRRRDPRDDAAGPRDHSGRGR